MNLECPMCKRFIFGQWLGTGVTTEGMTSCSCGAELLWDAERQCWDDGLNALRRLAEEDPPGVETRTTTCFNPLGGAAMSLTWGWERVLSCESGAARKATVDTLAEIVSEVCPGITVRCEV